MWERSGKNSKHEIRNSKQIQMTKISQFPNKRSSNPVFWNFRVWDLFCPRFVSNFDIRISDFYRGIMAEKSLQEKI
jgi:hypothetical protein